jgi:hypothetical protein
MDERIEPMMKHAAELGFSDGDHVGLAFAVEDILRKKRWRLHMNIAAPVAGLVADQGLSPDEYYRFMILGFSAGMIPCYSDALAKPAGAFFPLRCDRVHYRGKPRRAWRNRSGDV